MGIAVSRARSLPRASSRASSRASHRTASLPRAASRASIISSGRGSGIVSGSALAQPRLSPHAPCSSLAHRHRALTRASSHLRLYPVSGSATASWAPLLSLGLCCHPSGSVASRFYHFPPGYRLSGSAVASRAYLSPPWLAYCLWGLAITFLGWLPSLGLRLVFRAWPPPLGLWLGCHFLSMATGSAFASWARPSPFGLGYLCYRLSGPATAS